MTSTTAPSVDSGPQQQQQQSGIIDFSEIVPFGVLCQMFELCAKETRPNRKKELLHKLLSNYHGDDYFPLVRLILPQHDKERVYGLKEANLARLYVDILGISERSHDGYRLIHWKKPEAGTAETGDFASAVMLSLAKRCPEKGTLSIAAINKSLDDLTSAQDSKAKAAILRHVIRETTALEQKWFVRIILKELRNGMNEKTVLSYLHPNATDLYNQCSDLKRVCIEVKNPNFKFVQDGSTGVSLFHPIKSMLANRHPPEDIATVMQGKPFVIETKYDGERIQIHKDGDKIEFFSRNANNCSHLYGNHLKQIVKDHVNVKQCIIDGELLVWDELLNRFEDFGKIKNFVTNAKSQVNDGTNFGKQLCYVAFDVLLVSEKPLLELSLLQRSNILKRIITLFVFKNNNQLKLISEQKQGYLKPQHHVFEISEQKAASTSIEVFEALDNAILNRLEGVMLKCLDSPYCPGERLDSWIKIKPEYLNGVGDDLDLLIIAGFYGKGGRGGVFSHFMVGVPNGEEIDGHPVFVSFAKVGTGYSDIELQKLHDNIKPYVKAYSARTIPPYIRLGDTFTKELPDVWIEPSDSRILSVKAAQIVPSDKYIAGMTLRFPRVRKIRDDKTWKETTTLKEITELREIFAGRYAKRQLATLTNSHEDDEDGKKRKRRKRIQTENLELAGTSSHSAQNSMPKFASASLTIHSLYRDTDTSGVEIVSNALEGKEFCVLSGSTEHSKEDLEKLIAMHGGTKVQNPTQGITFAAIASRETVKVKNVIQLSICDVLDSSWLLKVAEESRIVPFSPKYIVFATEQTKERLLQEFDRFGDSYCEDATIESLRESFLQIDKQLRNPSTASTQFDEQEIDVTSLENHYFGKPWWAIFRSVIAYVDIYSTVGNVNTLNPCSSILPYVFVINFFGGVVLDTISSETTHIIVDDEIVASRLRYLKRISNNLQEEPPHVMKHIVKSSWINESVKSGEDLDEAIYSL